MFHTISLTASGESFTLMNTKSDKTGVKSSEVKMESNEDDERKIWDGKKINIKVNRLHNMKKPKI